MNHTFSVYFEDDSSVKIQTTGVIQAKILAQAQAIRTHKSFAVKKIIDHHTKKDYVFCTKCVVNNVCDCR